MLPLALLLTGTLAVAGDQVQTVERTTVLEDLHGYFPCMDCHEDQETNPTPRFLEEEHEVPLEWEDDAGDTHLVEFGERVPLAHLLGRGELRGNRRRNLLKIGELLDAAAYMEANDLSETDSVYVLTHGGANLWCLDCHSPSNRNNLHKLNGELLSFDESPALCGQCHGPIYGDWEQGVHGRTNGFWNPLLDTRGESRRQLCTGCHIPHAPHFRRVMPDPAPVPRIDNLHEAGEHPDDVHRGEYDLMGPHPWAAAPIPGTAKDHHD